VAKATFGTRRRRILMRFDNMTLTGQSALRKLFRVAPTPSGCGHDKPHTDAAWAHVVACSGPCGVFCAHRSACHAGGIDQPARSPKRRNWRFGTCLNDALPEEQMTSTNPSSRRRPKLLRRTSSPIELHDARTSAFRLAVANMAAIRRTGSKPSANWRRQILPGSHRLAHRSAT
jgi:hypothetical protein